MSFLRTGSALFRLQKPVLRSSSNLKASTSTLSFAPSPYKLTSIAKPASFVQSTRNFAMTSAPPVTHEILPEGYAIIKIRSEPVNAMSRELWQGLLDTVDLLEKNPKVQGVIFSSGLKKRNIFVAGVQLTEFYAPETTKENFLSFWKLFNTTIARIYNTPLITIAALNGFSPAGGTGLAIACDARIATQDIVMGLNEVNVGIPVPKYWCKMMEETVGRGQANRLCSFAELVKAPEVLSLNLVDQLVADDAVLLSTCEVKMKSLLTLDSMSRKITKEHFRSQTSKEWLEDDFIKKESETYWSFFNRDETLERVAKLLKRKPAAKSKL